MGWQKFKEFGDYYMITPAIGLTIAFGLMFGVAPMVVYNKIYSRAEAQAALKFGDKIAPLTPVEQKDWYEKMGVKQGEDPSREQLKLFLDDVVNSK